MGFTMRRFFVFVLIPDFFMASDRLASGNPEIIAADLTRTDQFACFLFFILFICIILLYTYSSIYSLAQEELSNHSATEIPCTFPIAVLISKETEQSKLIK